MCESQGMGTAGGWNPRRVGRYGYRGTPVTAPGTPPPTSAARPPPTDASVPDPSGRGRAFWIVLPPLVICASVGAAILLAGGGEGARRGKSASDAASGATASGLSAPTGPAPAFASD